MRPCEINLRGHAQQSSSYKSTFSTLETVRPCVRHARALSRGVLKPCISGTNEKKCLRKVRKSSVTSTPAFSTRNAFLFFCDVLALGTRRHASSARTAILRFRAMLRPKVPHPLRKSLIADRQIQHSTRTHTRVFLPHASCLHIYGAHR